MSGSARKTKRSAGRIASCTPSEPMLVLCRSGDGGPVDVQIGPVPPQAGPEFRTENQGIMRAWSTWTDWTVFDMVGKRRSDYFFILRFPSLVWTPMEISICQWNKQLKSYTRKDGVPVGTPTYNCLILLFIIAATHLKKLFPDCPQCYAGQVSP